MFNAADFVSGTVADPNITHTVHVFAVVRVPVQVENAVNHTEAIEAAEKAVDWYQAFEVMNRQAPFDMEFAEEFSHFLVDETGDEEHENSRFYHSNQIEHEMIGGLIPVIEALLAAGAEDGSECPWCMEDKDDHATDCVGVQAEKAVQVGESLVNLGYIPQRKRPEEKKHD